MHNFTPKEIDRITKGLAPWESMSFACGGWLQFYMFGVAKALQDAKLDKEVAYAGCSAGALTAVGLVMEGEFDSAIKYCNETCLPLAYERYTGLFRLSEYISGCMELYLFNKFESIAPIPKGKLQIAITKLPFFNTERVIEHESKDELMKSLLASCAAFPFSTIVNKKGNWYIDGGLSDFQPIIDEDTITVSPFYFSDCDIKPSRYVPLWWTFMPPKDKDTVEWLYNLGWEDCVNYIRSRGVPISQNNSLKRVYMKGSHPYDTPRRIRFLGYDMNRITHEYIGFIMDLLLLIMLIVLWKPLALVLIYIELWIRISYLSIIYLLKLSIDGVLRTIYELHFYTLYNPFVTPKSYVHNYNQDNKINNISKSTSSTTSSDDGIILSTTTPQGGKYWSKRNNNDLWDCITCVYSLSLFLRFISGRPSSVELRKHDRLARVSVLYRVFRHII